MTTPTSQELQYFARDLCNTLPAAVKRMTAGQYEQLMADVGKATGGWNWFIVGATVYDKEQNSHKRSLVRGAENVPGLPDHLLPAFKAWEAPFLQLNRDMAKVKQTITTILVSAKSWQEVRNMLPDYFLQPLLDRWQFEGMQRTAPDLHSDPPPGTWDQRLLDLYSRVGGTIDMLLGYKFL